MKGKLTDFITVSESPQGIKDESLKGAMKKLVLQLLLYIIKKEVLHGFY